VEPQHVTNPPPSLKILSVSLLTIAACASWSGEALKRAPSAAEPGTRMENSATPAERPATQPIKTADVVAGRRPPPPPNPEHVARAKQLAKQGVEAYRDGDYDRAEALLKEAIAVYPFLADANLTLGRIFLIRGSASRDRALITSARTMFEMARAIDPNLREVQVLLDLFREAPPE
jgi:hypothetical protein